MKVDQAFNFVAASEPVSTAGLLDERQRSALSEEGYTAVINLLPHNGTPDERPPWGGFASKQLPTDD